MKCLCGESVGFLRRLVVRKNAVLFNLLMFCASFVVARVLRQSHWTALSNAARGGHTEVVSLLLSARTTTDVADLVLNVPSELRFCARLVNVFFCLERVRPRVATVGWLSVDSRRVLRSHQRCFNATLCQSLY